MIEIIVGSFTFTCDKRNVILKSERDISLVRYYVIINGKEYQIEYYYYKELRRTLYEKD